MALANASVLKDVAAPLKDFCIFALLLFNIHMSIANAQGCGTSAMYQFNYVMAVRVSHLCETIRWFIVFGDGNDRMLVCIVFAASALFKPLLDLVILINFNSMKKAFF